MRCLSRTAFSSSPAAAAASVPRRALLAAERGYAVVVNYAGNVEAAEARLRAPSMPRAARRSPCAAMSADPSDVEHIFAAADRLGTLTGLVNNAGIVVAGRRGSTRWTPTRINRIFAVNVTGSFLCAAAAIRRMSTKHGGKGGAIVNLGSAAAKLGGAGVYVDYAAAKGAIDTFTVGLALEVAGEGIRVNAVRPGIIDTDIHASAAIRTGSRRMVPPLPMPRAGTAEEVAHAILWLLSDEASYTTGTTIAVTGGRAIAP